MEPDVSTRVRAILDEIERDASARRAALADAAQPSVPADGATPAPPSAAPEALARLQIELVALERQASTLRERLGKLDTALSAAESAVAVAVAVAVPYAEPPLPEALPAHPSPAALPPRQVLPTPPPPPPRRASSADAARLVAVEMAVAGHTRNEVGGHLRREFGISDPQQTLDEVFGEGTRGNSRMPFS